MMKLQTLAALAAGIALTGVAFVLAIGAFNTNRAIVEYLERRQ